MNAQLKGLEIECAVSGDHDFAIQDTVRRELILQRGDQFGKVTIERFLVAALNENFILIPKDDSPKSVPFWLKNPAVPLWDITDSLGKHWGDGRIYG